MFQSSKCSQPFQNTYPEAKNYVCHVHHGIPGIQHLASRIEGAW